MVPASEEEYITSLPSPSQLATLHAQPSQGTLNILVTGFGQFKRTGTKPNPSWEVVRRLPTELPQTPNTPPAKLHILPRSLPCSFTAVDALYKSIESSNTHYDVVLHCGVDYSYSTYTLETRAHKSGYRDAGVDGLCPSAKTQAASLRGAPEVLDSGLRLDDVLRAWDGPECQLGESVAAGMYTCEYALFNALARFESARAGARRASGKKTVASFLHFPGHVEGERGVQSGVQVTVGLLRAMVRIHTQRAQQG